MMVEGKVKELVQLAPAYLVIAGMAVVPTVTLKLMGYPAVNSTYPFITFSLIFIWFACISRALLLVFRKHPKPVTQIVADIREHWPRIVPAIIVIFAVPQTLDAATVIKRAIPSIQPYFADPLLIEIDAIFGVEPWQITHAIFGESATRIIDQAYVSWHFVQIAFCIWLVVASNLRLQVRAALSFQLAWLLMGGGMAIAFASVGPCFIDDFFGSDHFASLMSRLPNDLYAIQAMDYLLSVRGSEALGGGISAMPSLHVAIAVLVALCIREAYPRLQWAGWTYVLVIFVGSIHLAWHYASDGIVSAVGMILIWKMVGISLEVLPKLQARIWRTAN